MAVQSDLNKLLTSNPVELRALQGKSAAWFRKEVASLRRVGIVKPEALMRGDREQKTTSIIPGNMYMYIYDAKHKETLPYFDTFPLVFPFRKEKDGFYGLNMHYLPYQLRAQLLTRLLQFKTNKSLDETTRLKFSWALIGQASKFALAKPCVKHYLFSQVGSPFKIIHPQDWATTILIPSESFVGASSQKVWRESIKIIGS